MAGDNTTNSMLHQRLYFNLIGQKAIIANYTTDTRIAWINPGSVIEGDRAQIERGTGIWIDYLNASDHDYIYYDA